jgi:hypothetical protein
VGNFVGIFAKSTFRNFLFRISDDEKQNKMKEINTSAPARNNFYMMPEELLDTLVAKQDRIIELLEAKKEAALNGFITERQAMELLSKKVTWFWQMRKTGQLPFKKIGRTIYYSREDISSLLKNVSDEKINH